MEGQTTEPIIYDENLFVQEVPAPVAIPQEVDVDPRELFTIAKDDIISQEVINNGDTQITKTQAKHGVILQVRFTNQ